MAIGSGTRLGHYEILSLLGVGGMGEVYLARDSKLDRQVAIKVLPEAMTRDPERVARFEREAKVLASLNHPNIAAIHGFDDSDGTRFLVMEYVEGQTLGGLLKRGAVAVEDALDMAKQIAEALEAAHGLGVIHRDLKPANVMIRSDGTVKVLDFGLAKAMAEDSSTSEPADSPTITANFTRPGVVLGTAAYMSPEQARGRPLDKRTDIWSLGIILFECLTGKRLFQGETANDSMGAIMHKDPEWSVLPPSTPPTIQLLLRRCLTKDRKRRLHDIADARIELHNAIVDPTGTDLGLDPASATPVHSGAGASRLVIGAVLGGVVTALALWGGRAKEQHPRLRKFSIPVALVQDFWNTPTSVISPDGNRIAFVEDGKLWVRDLNELAARSIPNSDGAASPFWSPDSASIGFFDLQSLELRTFNLTKGTARAVCTLKRFWSNATATWGDQGTIVFDRANGLYEVEALGGEPTLRLVNDADANVHYIHPRFLPGGSDLLAIRQEGGAASQVVCVGKNSAKPLRGLDPGISFIVWSGDGFVLYQREGAKRGIWAAALSLEEQAAKGVPFRVTDGGQFPSAASDGTMLFQSIGKDQLVRVGRSGAQLETVGQPQQQIMNPAISPDGRHVAVSAIENDVRSVWIYNIARDTRVPLTADTFSDAQPTWSPSGSTVYFTSTQSGHVGVYKARVGTLDEIERAVVHDLPCAEAAVSSDGQYLAFLSIAFDSESNAYDIWQQGLGENATTEPVIATPANEMLPTISPDSRYVAFMSDRTGRWEVFVASFPDGGKVWGPLSTEGGIQPKWNGVDELFYVDEVGLMSVKFSIDNGFSWEPPVRLFSEQQAGVMLVDRAKVPISVRYDVDPTGESFIMVQNVSGPDTGIIIVQNWLEEFKTDK